MYSTVVVLVPGSTNESSAPLHIDDNQRHGVPSPSQDLDLLAKLERSFHQIQLSKVRSQPTITRFFSNRKPEVKDEDRAETGMLMLIKATRR